MAGGAPPVSSDQAATLETEDMDYWNFNTSDSFNEAFEKRYSQMLASGDPQGLQLDTFPGGDLPPLVTKDLTPLEKAQQAFEGLSASRGEKSLERLFTPDSAPYKLHDPVEAPVRISDLPFRNIPGAAGARESHVVIDLDEATGMDEAGPTFNFDFGDMPTLKANRTRSVPQDDEEDEEEYEYGQSAEDRDKRATMEWKFPTARVPTASKLPTAKRATMDWKFPTNEPTEPDEPDVSMDLPPAGEGSDLPPGFRPKLKHTATEPIGQFRDHIHPVRSTGPASSSPVRESITSMIDLDLGGFEDYEDIPRPSTASSATGSVMTDATSGNPFDLEEDPAQNEIDRNRFSYHRQYRSEGGQMKRSSHRSVPMHNRGSSLSGTEPDSNRSSTIVEDDTDTVAYEYNRKLSESMGHQLNGHVPGLEDIDLDSWPSFDPDSGFDKVRTYTDEIDDQIAQNRAKGIPMSPPGHEIAFPEVTAPNPDALEENADPDLVMEELDRLLEGLGASLEATSSALQQHTGVFEEDEEEE